MILRNSEGNVDIKQSMDSIQKELKEIWGQNPVQIKVLCSDEEVQKNQCHDCFHCRYWIPENEGLSQSGGYCSIITRFEDASDFIDPETAACREWSYADNRTLPKEAK